jgi:hypothetical protein
MFDRSIDIPESRFPESELPHNKPREMEVWANDTENSFKEITRAESVSEWHGEQNIRDTGAEDLSIRRADLHLLRLNHTGSTREINSSNGQIPQCFVACRGLLYDPENIP